jgi:RNA polymerase sigma factor (TIGR02999 family)
VTDNAITRLLHEWRDGNDEALEQLTPLVYDQLKQLAARIFRTESPGHTLQPTALVNEAFQLLLGADVAWQDRNHFYALSARLMRRILVNHANAKRSAKRGGGAVKVTLQDSSGSTGADSDSDIIALDMALKELGEFDQRKAEILELHYFGGLTYVELASVMQLAESTVHQDLRTAKAWLRGRLT